MHVSSIMGTTRPFNMADEKKEKNVLKVFKSKTDNFLNLFKKDKKEKDKHRENKREVVEKIKQTPKVPQVETIIANLRKLELEKSTKNNEEQNYNDEDDELKNFTFTIDRTHSESSNDSGFEKEDELDVFERKQITDIDEVSKNKESKNSVLTQSKNTAQVITQGEDCKKTENIAKKSAIKSKKNEKEQIQSHEEAKEESEKNKSVTGNIKNENKLQVDSTDDVIERLDGLKIEEETKEKKTKKIQAVLVSRAPIPRKGQYGREYSAPYPHVYGPNRTETPIGHVNTISPSGGLVIVNDFDGPINNFSNQPINVQPTDQLNQWSLEEFKKIQDGLNALRDAITAVGTNDGSKNLITPPTQEKKDDNEELALILELIEEESNISPEHIYMENIDNYINQSEVSFPNNEQLNETKEMESTENLESNFESDLVNFLLNTPVNSSQNKVLEDNRIKELEFETERSYVNNFPINPEDVFESVLSPDSDNGKYQTMHGDTISTSFNHQNEIHNNFIGRDRQLNSISESTSTWIEMGSMYPAQENMMSPFSETNNSNSPNMLNILSPPLSWASSDNEKYQDISQNGGSPTSIKSIEKEDSNQTVDEKTRTGNMTLKKFKDKQAEIEKIFSNKEYRQSCKDILEQRFKRLKAEERKRLQIKVALLEKEKAYGVLQHVLRALSSPLAESEDMKYALFALLCDLLLAKESAVFLDRPGLELLKTSVQHCAHRPELTGYLVVCVRSAVLANPKVVDGRHCVFEQLEPVGKSLVSWCARAGDAFAPVLAELLRRADQEMALFNLAQTDEEGYTALHIACKEHSASNPRLHIVYVLLKHGKMDLFKGDAKGDDTALHLAVNSANCDLSLVLLLFKFLDRKEWSKLAHSKNRSSITPVEYARSASRSATRQNYPKQVLDFLSKLRK